MGQNNHFETRDFDGRIILCKESQWNDHINTKYHLMEGCEDEILQALHAPTYGIRYIDRIYPNRRIYYRWDKSGDYLTKVIVEFKNAEGEGIGMVITAYQPTDIRKGDIPELKKND